MNIWIDILTPKQLLFFSPLIQELKSKNHVIVSTSRHYREIELLASKKGSDLMFIGKHGGDSLVNKLDFSLERSKKLLDIISNLDIDYAISFSSPECARVAFGLGLKHFCINDSPHAEKVCRLTIPLSENLFSPSIIPFSAWSPYGISRDQLVTYNALDPAAWLKRRSFKSVKKKDFGLDESKKTITVRLEESEAAYLLSSDKSYSKKLIDSLLLNFSDTEIFVLGRYSSQINDFEKKYGSKVKVAKDAVNGVDLLSVSDVFIGMGGTMTAESALLGVPTISSFQGEFLYTEKYLMKKRLLFRPGSVQNIVNTVKKLLWNKKIQNNLKNRANNVLGNMEDPLNVLITTLEKDN